MLHCLADFRQHNSGAQQIRKKGKEGKEARGEERLAFWAAFVVVAPRRAKKKNEKRRTQKKDEKVRRGEEKLGGWKR
jgi:hypothetical protein